MVALNGKPQPVNLPGIDPVIMLSRVFLMLALPLLVAQPPASWRKFTPKDGSFSVSLPAVPKETKQSLKLADVSVEVTMFLCEVPGDGAKRGDGAYVVSVTEYPPQEVQGGEEQRLRNARDGAVQNSKGKLFHERKIALDGHPGRELWIKTGEDDMIHARMVAVKQRLYQTMAIGPKNFVETKETAAFMDSFKLKK